MPFKSEKQRRWMHLHHPEIAGDWEKKYKDGGFVEKAKKASVQGDVVDAKLTPMEVILNAEHLAALQEETGIPVEKTFQKIGVPGFETGTFQARGGGAATKKDYLMKYQDSGVATDPYNIRGMLEKRYSTTDPGEQETRRLQEGKFGGFSPYTTSEMGDKVATGNYPNLDVSNLPLMADKKGGFFQNLFAGKKKNPDIYASKAGGGVASKKDYLMGYQDSGVAGSDITDITLKAWQLEDQQKFLEEKYGRRASTEASHPGLEELRYTGASGWARRQHDDIKAMEKEILRDKRTTIDKAVEDIKKRHLERTNKAKGGVAKKKKRGY
jgi:hypothetical protein